MTVLPALYPLIYHLGIFFSIQVYILGFFFSIQGPEQLQIHAILTLNQLDNRKVLLTSISRGIKWINQDSLRILLNSVAVKHFLRQKVLILQGNLISRNKNICALFTGKEDISSFLITTLGNYNILPNCSFLHTEELLQTTFRSNLVSLLLSCN